MSWPGKTSIARQHFSASLPTKSIPASYSNCTKDCNCKCKCCRGHVDKFVAFDSDSNASNGTVQKMIRLSTADMMLLMCVAQSRENFWSNHYYKANLLEDYAALIAPFNIEEGAKPNIAQLKEIMETITSGFRRALMRLSTSKASSALRPPGVAPILPGLRCGCEPCSLMPWNKLQQLEEHQWLHKSTDNWHCRLCYRRYFIQHTILLHLSRDVKRGQAGVLQENEAYKQRIIKHRRLELEEEEQSKIQPVEELRVRMPKRTELNLIFEAELVVDEYVPPKKIIQRKSCHLNACPLCAHPYRFSFSHQLHMKKHHPIAQLPAKRFSCASCERIFRDRRYYLKHLRQVREKYSLRVRKYECGCSFRYQLERTLANHVSEVHTRHFSCLICKAKTTGRCCDKHTRKEARAAINADILQRRALLGLPPPAKPRKREYACDKCDKVYSNICAMRDHQQIKHLKRKDFVCESCGKEFYTAKMVYEHVRRVHTTQDQVHCDLCNLTIKEKTNFKRHCESAHHLKRLAKKEGKSHDEYPEYKSAMIYCKFCERNINKAAYKLHLRTNTHKSHERRYQMDKATPVCPMCDIEFACREDRIRHMRKVHFPKQKMPKIEMIDCHTCNLTIKGKASYERHCQTPRHLEQLKDAPCVIDKDDLSVPMFYCEFCDRNLKGERIYKIHCESSAHQRRLTEWVERQNDE